ncbi:MAG: hypothetical protein QOI77_2376, partial [Blastocatellia bacterium]|nr:hypothetical protein [Blastocatellia bacterium]
GAADRSTRINRIQGFVEDFAGGETQLSEIRHRPFGVRRLVGAFQG